MAVRFNTEITVAPSGMTLQISFEGKQAVMLGYSGSENRYTREGFEDWRILGNNIRPQQKSAFSKALEQAYGRYISAMVLE